MYVVQRSKRSINKESLLIRPRPLALWYRTRLANSWFWHSVTPSPPTSFLLFPPPLLSPFSPPLPHSLSPGALAWNPALYFAYSYNAGFQATGAPTPLNQLGIWGSAVIVIVIVKTICNTHKVNAKHRIGGAGRVTRWPEQSLVKSSIKIKSF